MFFERVKELCTANNIKISNLLKELGMSPGNLTRWKNGTVPDGNTLIAIAKYFDVSTDYLLGIDDIKKSVCLICSTTQTNQTLLLKDWLHIFNNATRMENFV